MTGFPGFPRDDERATFVVRKTGETCVWKGSRGFLWHATVDGLRAVCSRAIVLVEDDPYPSTVDRSNDTMTCKRCQDMVTRKPTSA
jgi:hypothetical protein